MINEHGDILELTDRYSSEAIRRNFQQRAEQQTQMPDNRSQPFGDPKRAARLHAYNVIVEVYPDGGVAVFIEGGITISTRVGQPLGGSGQLGFTQVIVTPDSPSARQTEVRLQSR